MARSVVLGRDQERWPTSAAAIALHERVIPAVQRAWYAHSVNEANAATVAAAKAPGIAKVENHLVISP